MMLAQSGAEAMLVAALHDAAEDTDITIANLVEAGWSQRVVDAVGALTRRDGEDYFDFAKCAVSNRLARPVMVAYLRDNLRQSDDVGAETHDEVSQDAGNNRRAALMYATALLIMTANWRSTA